MLQGCVAAQGYRRTKPSNRGEGWTKASRGGLVRKHCPTTVAAAGWQNSGSAGSGSGMVGRTKRSRGAVIRRQSSLSTEVRNMVLGESLGLMFGL